MSGSRGLDVGRCVLFGALAWLVVATSFAQVSTGKTKPTVYDVVSIKLNKSGDSGVDVESIAGHYLAKNITLTSLLSGAYDVRQDLISGVDGPVESARFDIEAKIVEPDVAAALKKLSDEESRTQRRLMLKAMLEERFQVRAHTETKVLPVYELVIVPGKVKLKETAADAKHGASTSVHGGRDGAQLTARDVEMATFAKTLAGQVHRMVINKTGLTDTYDFEMKWSNDDSPQAAQDMAPNIFTALQEQLGLKLQSAKGPVPTLVVDHAEMPSEN